MKKTAAAFDWLSGSKCVDFQNVGKPVGTMADFAF